MILKFQEPQFHGLFLVISGGQCGADRGGLEAAFEMGVETGGMAPLGWRTARGAQPELARYGLVESTSPDYQVRTRYNVGAADGTLLICSNAQSPGSRGTFNYAKKIGKPSLTLMVYGDDGKEVLTAHAMTTAAWIVDNRISVLNVAGNRDGYGSNFHHWAAHGIVQQALENLRERDFLVSRT